MIPGPDDPIFLLFIRRSQVYYNEMNAVCRLCGKGGGGHDRSICPASQQVGNSAPRLKSVLCGTGLPACMSQKKKKGGGEGERCSQNSFSNKKNLIVVNFRRKVWTGAHAQSLTY